MKTRLLATIFSFSATFFSYGQEWEWAKAINLPFFSPLFGVKVSAGSGGEFYISSCGWDQNYGYPAGSCIVKFDAGGTEKWRRSWGEKIRVLKIQTLQNDLLVCGEFMDTVNLSGNAHVSQSKTDGFLFCLDQAGELKWWKQISGPGNENVQDVSVDKGIIYITGGFSDQSHIDNFQLTTTGIGSSYVTKLDQNGNVLSLFTADNVGTGGYNYGYRIRSDGSGNIFLLGFYSQVKFNSFEITNFNEYGAQYLAGFDKDGNSLLLKGIIDGTEHFKDFCVKDSHLYFTGDGSWTNGGWSKTEKYSSTGDKVWTKRRSGFYYEYSSNSIANTENGFYTVGYEGDPRVPDWNTVYSLMISHLSEDGEETCTFINTRKGRIDSYDITETQNKNFILTGLTPDYILLGNTELNIKDGIVFIASLKYTNTQTSIIKNENGGDGIVVTPNPSNGIFSVRSETPENGEIVLIRDILGNCILREEKRTSVQGIDLSNLPKGMYFIDIYSDNKKRSVKIVLN